MGETAPLIIIGMIAFIPDTPSMITGSCNCNASADIHMGWNARGYVCGKTAAGIIVLLGVLISLNAIAIYLKKKFELNGNKGII